MARLLGTRRIRRTWAAVLLLVLSQTALRAEAVEIISGRVVSARSGLPLAGFDLDLFDVFGVSLPLAGDTTNARGEYSLTLPGPGTYTIRADPATSQPFATVHYNGAFLKSAAQPIVVGLN